MRRKLGDYVNEAGLDAALAVGLALLGLADAATSDRVSGERVAFGVAAIVMAVPLAWRRRYPLGVAAVAMSGLLAVSFVAADPDAIWALVVLLVVAYSLGAYQGDLAGSLVGVAMCVLAVSVTIARDPSDSLSNIPPTVVIFIAVPWAAGRTLHRRERAKGALEEQAARLAADRDAAAQRAVADERGRIARELHDVVAHAISVIAVQAGAAEAALDTEPERARRPLVATQRMAREALAEMRRLVTMLREEDQLAELRPPPGLGDLPQLIEQSRDAGLRVDLAVEGEEFELPAGQDLAAFRIIQEALTNSLKHARPASVDVRVRYGAQHVELEAVDRAPTTSPVPGGGSGLAGMHERVALYGGTLDVHAGPDGGYLIRAVLPVG